MSEEVPDDSLVPDPGNEPPDDSNSDAMPLVFTLTLGLPAFDAICERHGVFPTEEARLTIIQEMYKRAPHWIDNTIGDCANTIKISN